MSDQNKKRYLEELVEIIILTFDGKVSEEQFSYLEKQLNTSSQARECYYKMLAVYTSLNDYNSAGIVFSDFVGNTEDEIPKVDKKVLLELAEDEFAAPVIELPTEKPETSRELPNPVEIKTGSPRRKVSLAGLAAVAALILLVVYIKINPLTLPMRAALLKDSCRPSWSGSITHLNDGDSIYLGEVVTLNSGIIELTTERDVSVFLEGPAQFEFKTQTELSLNYGHVYSKVMKKGVGFTVKTPNAMIVDLGTEFSVKYDKYCSDTQVQMYKGSAVISSNNDSADREILKSGTAKAVSNKGEVSDIAFDKSLILDRTLSKYEKILNTSKVAGYCTFNKRYSWVNDYVGSGNLSNKVQYHDVQLTDVNVDKDGNYDTALFFDNIKSQSYAGIEDLYSYEKDSFTVGLWFKVDEDVDRMPNKQFIASKFNPKNQVGWRIGLLRNTPFIRISSKIDQQVYHYWLSYDKPIASGWHYIVMVVDRKKDHAQVYLDGSDTGWGVPDPDKLISIDNEFSVTMNLHDSLPKNIKIDNNVELHLGIRSRSMDRPFVGWIYDIAIWDKALSSPVIKKLYQQSHLK